jgi:hypothetical protein
VVSLRVRACLSTMLQAAPLLGFRASACLPCCLPLLAKRALIPGAKRASFSAEFPPRNQAVFHRRKSFAFSPRIAV